jgi:RNA-directed DNA polymerase
VERSLLAASEPKDKLDAMTGHAFAMAMAALGVNGPEDDDLDWNAIDWRKVQRSVSNLRRRIFRASKEGDQIALRCEATRLSRVRGNPQARF